METALGFIIQIIGAHPDSYSKMMISDRPSRTNVMSCWETWETSGDAVGCAESLRIVAKAQQIQVGIHGSWIVIQQAPKIGKPQELLHGLEVNQVPCQDDLVNISWFRWLEKDCFPIESPEPT